MIKRVLLLTVCFIPAVYLDTAVLPALLPYLLRPMCLLSLIFSASDVFSLREAGCLCVLGGITEDMLCSEALGLTTAVYLAAAAILGAVLHRNSLKKGFLMALLYILAVFVQLLTGGFFLLYGAKTDFLYSLLFPALCRALWTAVLAMGLRALFIHSRKGRIAKA